MQTAARLVAYGLFFFSGATALVYQVTWLRDLSLIFGASFEATSIVLASFMGGLALGGFLAGRVTESLHRPLSAYGALEIAIALFAMLLPGLLHGVDDFYVSAAHSAGGVTPTLNIMRFVFSFGILVLPTLFMGATLPVLIRFVVHAHGELGTRLSLLYGINTLGAAAGAMTAGFILLPQLGASATQTLAVTANLIIGAFAIAVDLLSRNRVSENAERVADAEIISESPDLGTMPLRLVFIGTSVAGFTALSLEVMWTRAISTIIGSTTYSFTIMLTAFLLGIWLGSWIHASFPMRRINESLQFGSVLLMIGVTSFVSTQLIPRVPKLVVWLNLVVFRDTEQIRFGTSLMTAFAVMLIPSIFMGIAFPVASQARARLVQKFGESVGDTLGLNTLGAVLGSLSAGFVLIPTLGLQGGMLFASCLAIGYAMIVLTAALTARSERRHVVLPVIVAAALALIIGGPLVAPRWDLTQIATFRHDRLGIYYDSDAGSKSSTAQTDLIFYKEGHSSTVAVLDGIGHKEERRTRAIVVNGKIVATDSPPDMAHQLLLGHVPVLLHPNPKSALVIGFGSGVTLGAVAAHREIDELTLVDIEPAVLDAGPLFRHINDGVLDDPRLKIVIQDGRNFVKTTDRKFDVITADPVHPWAAGSAYLYTTNYYKQASQRLNEGGVMCQWVPLVALTVENIKSIIASFGENFEYVSVWSTFADLVLVGSNSPFKLSMEQLAERIAEPDVNRQLSWVNFGETMKFMSRLRLETPGVRIFTEDAIINTDDNLYLEFSSPLAIGKSCTIQNLCGMATWYPPRIEMVETWSPLFDSAADAREVMRRHRRERSPRLMNLPVAEPHRPI
jgi:spermidine synthase